MNVVKVPPILNRGLGKFSDRIVSLSFHTNMASLTVLFTPESPWR